MKASEPFQSMPNARSYESFLHRLDMALRQEVAAFASSHSMIWTLCFRVESMTQVMQRVSERRKEALKQGRMLSEEVDDSNMDDIIQCLVKSFQSECERACLIASKSCFK